MMISYTLMRGKCYIYVVAPCMSTLRVGTLCTVHALFACTSDGS